MSTTDTTARNVETARRFVALVEEGKDLEALCRLIHPEIQQEEFPNAIFPRGTRRDLAGLRASFEKGRGLLASQRYEIVNIVGAGDHVVVELAWTGTLAVDAGPLRAGEVLRARCAGVMEFRDGLIYRQRQYDCYEPREPRP